MVALLSSCTPLYSMFPKTRLAMQVAWMGIREARTHTQCDGAFRQKCKKGRLVNACREREGSQRTLSTNDEIFILHLSAHTDLDRKYLSDTEKSENKPELTYIFI